MNNTLIRILAVAVLLVTAGGASALDIDDFQTGMFLGTQPIVAQSLGSSSSGFGRTLDATGSGNLTIGINSGLSAGVYGHSQDSGVTGQSSITYSLGGQNLAADANGFRLNLARVDLNGVVRIAVNGVSFDLSSTTVLIDNGGALPSFADFLFSDFPGVDFTNVSSIVLQIDGTATPALDVAVDRFATVCSTRTSSGGSGTSAAGNVDPRLCAPTVQPAVCVPFDRQLTLTHNQTKVVNTANFFSLDPASCPIAYVVAWAKDEALGEKRPIKWNHLSGSTYTRRAPNQPQPNAVAAAQAIAVTGDPQDLVAQGAAIVGAQGGAFPDVPFDGTAYAELPNRLFTDFIATTGPRGSRLTLLTPDINVPRQNPTTQVAVDWWNQAEDGFSDSLTYRCIVRTRLEDVSSAFTLGALGSFAGNLLVTPLGTPGILGVIEELEPNRWTMRNMFHDDPGLPGGVINTGGLQSGSALIFPLLDVTQTSVLRITNNHPDEDVQVHLVAVCGEDR